MQTSYPLTILYIEDNIEIRQHLTRFLHRNGYQVIETDNVNEGCTLFRSHKIDLAIVDLHLPNQNGMEFIRCLREKGIHTPVIITTAFSDKEYLLDAINLDVTRYLIKPFQKNDLLDAIQTAAERFPPHSVQTHNDLGLGYHYDPVNKLVNKPDGTSSQLSKKEYLLLELLLNRKMQIVGYDTIESMVWKTAPMSIDALRTLVRGLRKKTHPHLIRNINRIGYRIGI